MLEYQEALSIASLEAFFPASIHQQGGLCVLHHPVPTLVGCLGDHDPVLLHFARAICIHCPSVPIQHHSLAACTSIKLQYLSCKTGKCLLRKKKPTNHYYFFLSRLHFMDAFIFLKLGKCLFYKNLNVANFPLLAFLECGGTCQPWLCVCRPRMLLNDELLTASCHADGSSATLFRWRPHSWDRQAEGNLSVMKPLAKIPSSGEEECDIEKAPKWN